MIKSDDVKERRKFRRYPAAVLKAQIREKKGIFSEKWLDSCVVDCSEHGVALILNDEPDIDQSMTVKLVLEMDMGNITIDRIDASVRNKFKTDKGWRSGLEFSDLAIRDCGEKLERITRLLDKSSSVNERLHQQVHKNKPPH